MKTIEKKIISTTSVVNNPISECYTLAEIRDRVSELIEAHGESATYSFNYGKELSGIQEEVCVQSEETDEQQKFRIQKRIKTAIKREKQLQDNIKQLQDALEKI